MKNIVKDFLETRKSIASLRSKIDVLQGKRMVNFDIDADNTKIENALDYAFNKIFSLEDAFSACYNMSYYEYETNYLLTNAN